MEFLTTTWTFVRELIAGNYITAGLLVAPFVLPNAAVRKVGLGLGRSLSLVLRQKIGKSGEAVEGYFQGSINALVQGLNEGLDADDTTESV